MLTDGMPGPLALPRRTYPQISNPGMDVGVTQCTVGVCIGWRRPFLFVAVGVASPFRALSVGGGRQVVVAVGVNVLVGVSVRVGVGAAEERQLRRMIGRYTVRAICPLRGSGWRVNSPSCTLK